ncbi:mucin-16 [Anolis carolinensis]|uniref:mucin-16 n=1 Tax=Anolis carolinensis TaxID=28377 RepID=UPI002F2B32F9
MVTSLEPTTSPETTIVTSLEPTTSPPETTITSQEPTTSPPETTITSQEPITSPPETTITSQEPTTSPPETTITSQEPTTSPETTITSQEPTTSPPETTITSQEPTTSPETTITSQEPTTSPPETTITSQEPTTSPPETTITSQEPTTSPPETTITSQEPTTSPPETTITSQEPTTSPPETTITSQEPTTSPPETTITSQEPTTSPETTITSQEPTTSPPETTITSQEPTTSPETTITSQEPTTSPPETTITSQEPTTSPPETTITSQEPTTSPPETTITSQEPTTSPPETTITSQEPTTSPPETTITSQEPTTSPSETTITSQEPITSPPETTITSQEPTTSPPETTITSQEPTTSPPETTITSQEPTTSPPETTITSQEPTTSPPETTITSQEPITSPPETTITSQEPTTSPPETTITSQEPTTSPPETTITSQEPTTSPPETTITSQEPTTSPPETTITSQEPTTSPPETTITSQEPTTSPPETTITSQEPTTSPPETTITSQEPITSPPETTITSQEPTTSPPETTITSQEPTTSPPETTITSQEPTTSPPETTITSQGPTTSPPETTITSQEPITSPPETTITSQEPTTSPPETTITSQEPTTSPPETTITSQEPTTSPPETTITSQEPTTSPPETTITSQEPTTSPPETTITSQEPTTSPPETTITSQEPTTSPPETTMLTSLEPTTSPPETTMVTSLEPTTSLETTTMTSLEPTTSETTLTSSPSVTTTTVVSTPTETITSISTTVNESLIHAVTERPIDRPVDGKNVTTPGTTTLPVTTLSSSTKLVLPPVVPPNVTTTATTTSTRKETTTSATTPTPDLEEFTVNFTITNLRYREGMGTPNSSTFNATERAVTTLMGRILRESSIGPAFSRCKVVALKSAQNGDATWIDSVCTYRNDSATPVFDRVTTFREIVNRTNGFTTMGPYKLKQYSLYVDGYHEDPPEPTVPPTPSWTVVNFTTNFTVTNLRYKPDMGILHSKTFNATEVPLVTLNGFLIVYHSEYTILLYTHYSTLYFLLKLDRCLNRSSIGPVFLGCKVTTLRRLNDGDATGTDYVCSYRNDSTGPTFDRVKVYHEIVNQTRNFTQIGPYKLEEYSLYVNGYHETPLESTLQTPTVGYFTTNFTITNLRYKPEMAVRHSKAFNATERTLLTLLGRSFNTSSIRSVFMGCEVTALRPVKNGDQTKVDSVCTYRNDSVFDRVKVYHDLVNGTNGFTKMGPYRLEPNSLYINGYNEGYLQTTVSPKTTPTTTVAHFMANLTVTNLRFKPEMGIYHSKTFNATERPLLILLGRMLNQSNVIGSRYLGCQVTTFRPLNHGEETGMDAVCTYRNDSAAPAFDRVQVHHELVNKTSGFTKMGPYKLDPNSLYVNGYNEALVRTTPRTPMVENFTMDFIITNLRYKTEMGIPKSKAFNATEMPLTTLLARMFNQSNIGPAFKGCDVTTLRPMKNGDETGVNAVCRHTVPAFDRVEVYHDVVNRTKEFTRLGPYKLDQHSLYVNGYNERTHLPGQPPMTSDPETPVLRPFTVNYTLSSLPYTTDMGIPGSRKFNDTERVVKHIMESLLNKTSVGPAFTSCKVQSFRSPETGAAVMVDQLCGYWKNRLAVPFDRVKVYDELLNLTKDGTKFRHIDMEKNSLRVNGYPPSSLAPEGAGYELSFTIVNENLTNTDPSSPEYKRLEASINDQMNQIFGRSRIGNGFKLCVVTGLRYGSIVVDCKCYFDVDMLPSEKTVKETFRQETQNATSQWLGSQFQLRSVTVRAIDPAIEAVTDISLLALDLNTFTVNFTIINLPYKEEMKNPNSGFYRKAKESVEQELDRLYQRSNLGANFMACFVESFRPTSWRNQTGVNSVCMFTKENGQRPYDRGLVYDVFKNLTGKGSSLGRYMLDDRSLLVNGYPTEAIPIPARKELPFWAIILICLSVLLAFLLLFLLCFLARRRSAGKYQVQQNVFGIYFPHLEMRKGR